MGSGRDGIRRLVPPTHVGWLVVAAGFVLVPVLAGAFILPLTQPRLELGASALIRTSALWSWTTHLAPLVPESPRTVGVAVLGLTLISVLALVAGVALTWGRAATRGRVAIVTGTTVLAWSAMMLALPTLDSDIFSYIADGRVAAVHGANPEVVAPIAFPDDPILPFTSPQYRGIPGDNKLPLWTNITAILAGVAGPDPTTGLLLYRGLFLAGSLANLTLVALFLRRTRPDVVLAGLVLFGWNPIVLMTSVSKVDTLMATFALLGLILLADGRRRMATGALALSVLIKLITLPLLAVRVGRSVVRGHWREAGADTLVAVIVAAIVYAPFWAGPQEVAGQVTLLGGGRTVLPDLIRPVLDLGFVGLLFAVSRWDDGSARRTAIGWSIVMLFFGGLLTTLGLSWYLITMVALIAVAGDELLAAGGIGLSAVSFIVDRLDRFEIGLGGALPGSILYLAAGGLIVATVLVGRARRRTGSSTVT